MYPSVPRAPRRPFISPIPSLSLPFDRLPSRVCGHVLIVVVCLVAAYVGQADHHPDRLGAWSDHRTALQPSALASPGAARADTLAPLPSLNTQAGAPARLEIMHYNVQAGDTVASLAGQFDISEDTIRWTNNLAPGDKLAPGQPLVILPVSGILYTVQPGDTVATIAARFQSDRDAIDQLNQIKDPAQLTAGTQVVVPGARIEDVTRPMTVAPPVATPVAATSVSITAAPTPVAEDTRPHVLDWVPYAERFLHPGAAVAPPAPKALTPISYTVVDGDTLSGIAAKFGVSPESIAFSSGIQGSADSLSINQKLVIPPVPGIVHVVQDGDTLEAVAERYGVAAQSIAQANGLKDPFLLQIGQILVVPNGTVPAPAPDTSSAAPATQTYTVQDGDSLSDIADRYGVDLQALIDANGLDDPAILQPGQQLVIPAGGSPSDSSSSQSAASSDSASSDTSSSDTSAAPAMVKSAPRPAVVSRPAPKPAPAPSSGGWGIVGVASKFLGFPYVWGGTSPGSGFDCSGFVYYVYQAAGNPIPRDMWGQLQSGTRVSMGNLQPGDIVFFANTYQAGLSHDGIYIGGGRFIHAADYGIGVEVSSLSSSYYAAHYFGATRP